MSTTTQSNKNESTRTNAGWLCGIDGAGFRHYWKSATRTMTVVDPSTGESKQFQIPSGQPDDRPMIDWCIATIEEHEAYWDDVRFGAAHEQKWLQGELPVGEFPGDDA